MTIFVSIASYRDPQLGPTVRNCLAKADYPGELRFGICWQHAPDEPWPLERDARFRVLDVDYRESRGACWARAEIPHLMDGEDWYLQLDSHHRFAQGWDSRLIRMAENSGSAKPIISTYPAGFRFDDSRPLQHRPWQMTFGRWSPEGIPLFLPQRIARWRQRTVPIRARFLGACFLFARAEWATEVPYDPELYFTGEEISLAVRSYTAGYDFFHPHRTLIWHQWNRDYRPKHWDDHRGTQPGEVHYADRDQASLDKVRSFLRDPYTGRYGCGTVRTVADYERFAGLDLARCRTHEDTLRNLEPPTPVTDPDWATRARPWRIVLTLIRDRLDPAFLAAGTLADLTFHEPNGAAVHEVTVASGDWAVNELGNLTLTRHFSSACTPVRWTVAATRPDGREIEINGAVNSIQRLPRWRVQHTAFIANRLAETETPRGAGVLR